jgi:hypothetical protein
MEEGNSKLSKYKVISSSKGGINYENAKIG